MMTEDGPELDQINGVSIQVDSMNNFVNHITTQLTEFS